MKNFKEWFIDNHIQPAYPRKRCEELYEYYIEEFLTYGKHNGDCIDEPQNCTLCMLENNLLEYYKYTQKEYLKENDN